MGEQQLHRDVGPKITPKSELISVMTNWELLKDGPIVVAESF